MTVKPIRGIQINQDETSDFSRTFQRILLQTAPVPNEKARMVLDTDTYNEIDDQFALGTRCSAPKS